MGSMMWQSTKDQICLGDRESPCSFFYVEVGVLQQIDQTWNDLRINHR